MSAPDISYFRAMANERGKFALQIGYQLDLEHQTTLEDALVAGSIRLIDITPIAHGPPGLFRVFVIMAH